MDAKYELVDRQSGNGEGVIAPSSSRPAAADDRIPEQPPSRTRVLATVSFHIATASSVTLTNKAALDAVNAPLTLLILQMLISVACMWAAYATGYAAKPPSLANKSLLRAFAPLVAVKVMSLVSKTYCLASVPASFYQIVRGLLLPMTVVMSYFFLSSKPSPKSLVPIGIVCLGFVVGIQGEFDSSVGMIGVALGVWSSFTTACDTIVVKKYTSELKLPVMDMVYMSSVGIAASLVPMILLSSETVLWISPSSYPPVSAEKPNRLDAFVIQVVLSGLLTFLLNIAAFMQIKVTSPTTHMISTAFRGILQSLLAVLLLGEHLNAVKWASIAVILTGTIGYTFVKEQERKRKEQTVSHAV